MNTLLLDREIAQRNEALRTLRGYLTTMSESQAIDILKGLGWNDLCIRFEQQKNPNKN